MVKKMSRDEVHSINLKIQRFGVDFKGATLVEGESKIWISIDKGCAVNVAYKKIANFLYEPLKRYFGITPSTIIVEGREICC